MVVSYGCDQVLLTHHKKLGRWLQLGGHSDGHPLTWEVALREAYEESGLGFLKLYGSPQPTVYLPFDVDAHRIPARGAEAAHIHYDLRYVVFGDSSAPLTITSESHDLRWVSMDEVALLSDEPSLLRMVHKVRDLFKPHPNLLSPKASREVSLTN
jgi:8-oxo-dGTP pyrophosphatase MutT (NUDIX family)